MSKVVKEMIISEIQGQLADSKDLVILDLSKLDALTNNKIRLDLQKKGISLLGVKNSLARLALKESGITTLDDILNGPSTLVWGGEDIVALSREMSEWAKKFEAVEIKGGVVDGQGIDSVGVEEISKGPSRLELIGQIAGLLLSPASQVAGALLGPGGIISGQMKALSEKESEPTEGGDAA